MAEIFFIFSIVYLTGSSSYPIRLKLFFEYLNHICNPAFAVHPCPSPIFCHQEDKSELRGATPHFLPRLTPKPAQEWLPANFTVHSDFSSLFLPYGQVVRVHLSPPARKGRAEKREEPKRKLIRSISQQRRVTRVTKPTKRLDIDKATFERMRRGREFSGFAKQNDERSESRKISLSWRSQLDVP